MTHRISRSTRLATKTIRRASYEQALELVDALMGLAKLSAPPGAGTVLGEVFGSTLSQEETVQIWAEMEAEDAAAKANANANA